jgi:hypothetical protein
MSKEVAVPKSFHEHFEIVARYYGVRGLGEYDALKKYARKSLKEFREYTLKDFANMADWMSGYLPDPEKKGIVAYTGSTPPLKDGEKPSQPHVGVK